VGQHGGSTARQVQTVPAETSVVISSSSSSSSGQSGAGAMSGGGSVVKRGRASSVLEMGNVRLRDLLRHYDDDHDGAAAADSNVNGSASVLIISGSN